MTDLVRKACEPSVIKAVKNGVYTFVISDERPDLVGDVVKQVVPVSERIPGQIDHAGTVNSLIGHWQDFSKSGKSTLANLVLFEKGISQTADLVRELLDRGVKMAASIGFKGKGEPISGGGYLFKTAQLLEVSVVAVPCHPLALSISKKLDFPASVVNEVIDIKKQTTLDLSDLEAEVVIAQERLSSNNDLSKVVTLSSNLKTAIDAYNEGVRLQRVQQIKQRAFQLSKN